MSKIIGIGTDIIEIERISKAVSRNERFLHRLFTPKEREYFANRGNKPQHIAGLFAAKEAAVKAAGGFLTDYEVLHYDNGKPYIVHDKHKRPIRKLDISQFPPNFLSGKLRHAQFSDRSKDGCEIEVSISHCREYAAAFVVMFTNK